MEPTEERVRRAQAGDDVAFTRLVRDVYPHIYRWALVQTGSLDDADDVAQTALVRMHHHLHAFRHDARFTTWLYAIVRRVAADWRRAQRRRQTREQHYGEELSWIVPVDAARIDTDRTVAAVHLLLRELPLRQREVFDLAELQGVPAAEIALMLDLSPSTVRVHLLRARRAMRSMLLARGSHRLEDCS